MTDDDTHVATDEARPEPEQPSCPARRSMLGCALALTVAQFLGESSAEAATSGNWTSAGAIKAFSSGKPKLVNLVGGQAPVFITKLSATSWQCLYAVCTHASVALNLAPSHPTYAFQCPNHGARFANNGKVVRGPATHPLLKLPVKIVNGKVMVNLAGFV